MPDFGSATFSQTDSSNATGTMPSWSGSAAPSTLDDAGRALQGAVTREWNWRNFTVTATGTADAKVLTYSVAPAAYYNGQRFAFIANTTNTTTATLNVNSLGAKSIRKMIAGTATTLAAGDMVAGSYVEVAYNTAGDYFVWLNGEGVTPQFTSIELGNASDTTITRSAAGVLAVEGGVIPKENRANTFSVDQLISTGASQALLSLQANAAVAKTIQFLTGANSRWVVSSETTAESGSDAGSNFIINSYNDAGAYLSTPFQITRSTGNVGIGKIPSVPLDVTGQIRAMDGTVDLRMLPLSASSAGLVGTISNHAVVFTQNNAEAFRVDTSKNVLVTSSGGLGYGTGSGGTVTQLTSKATGVTLNKTNGSIVMNAAALGAGATTSFTLTNSTIAATDVVIVNNGGGAADPSQYDLRVKPGAGNLVVWITNRSGGSLSEAYVINFAVIKAVTA